MIKNVILMWDRFWWHGNRWRRCARLEWMKRRCAQSRMPRCTPDGDEAERGALSDEELHRLYQKSPAYEAQIRNSGSMCTGDLSVPYVGNGCDVKGWGHHPCISFPITVPGHTRRRRISRLASWRRGWSNVFLRAAQIKPEPEIYHSLLERFHLAEEEGVFLMTDRTMTAPSPAASLPLVLPVMRTPDRN